MGLESMKREQHPHNLYFRSGRTADLAVIENLLHLAGMDGEIDPRHCLIAESQSGILGFARVETIRQKAFIRPIVVHPSAQQQGIGRGLIQRLLAQYSELRVVSRGDAQEFYRRMGFAQFPWSEVPEEIRCECELCPQASSCQPIPMVGYRQGESQHIPIDQEEGKKI